MADSNQSLLQQVQQLRTLFQEAAPTDQRLLNDYAWLMVKLLNAQVAELGSTYCRQLLADHLRLPIARPSAVHSAILSSAVRVANAFPDFRFDVFLRMWAQAAPSGVYTILPMLVTRIRETLGKEGRKYHFVTLTSPDGLEVECINHKLQPSPLHPLPEGKRHFVNIGQLYDCVLCHHSTSLSDQSSSGPSKSVSRTSSLDLQNAFLSPQKPSDVFPTAIGYVEAIDDAHNHIHVYDEYSRHLVASKLRFSRERPGDFVRFIPVIPQTSRFKTAVILSPLSSTSPEVQHILREIRITSVNREKGFAAWELVHTDAPITELLSPLQLAQGEISPSFTSGFLNLAAVFGTSPATPIPEGSPSDLSVAQTLQAFVYLKRGKDGQKRPHVACIKA